MDEVIDATPKPALNDLADEMGWTEATMLDMVTEWARAEGHTDALMAYAEELAKNEVAESPDADSPAEDKLYIVDGTAGAHYLRASDETAAMEGYKSNWSAATATRAHLA